MNVFNPIQPFRFWVQHILPQVYDDSLSYQELLYKVVAKINEMADTINGLPEFIEEKIKELAPEVLAELLSDIIVNVKMPPAGIPAAKGDGVTDDTASFQQCIDYAQTNSRVILVPNGKYLIDPLQSTGEITIMGLDTNKTTLYLANGANKPHIKVTGNNFNITGISFDGRYQTQINDVTCLDVTGNFSLLENLSITNYHYGIKVVQTEGETNIAEIELPYILKGGCQLSGGVFNVYNLTIKDMYAPTQIYAFKADASKSIFDNLKSYVSIQTPIQINGANNYVTLTVENATTPEYNVIGLGNNVILKSVDYLANYTRAFTVISPSISFVGTVTAQEVTGLLPPENDEDATNKKYVDDAITSAGTAYVKKAGDTMTGGLVAPTVTAGALRGDTLNTSVSVTTPLVTGLVDPVNDSDAANKKYVDEHGGGGGGDFVKKTGDTMSGALVVGSVGHGVRIFPDGNFTAWPTTSGGVGKYVQVVEEAGEVSLRLSSADATYFGIAPSTDSSGLKLSKNSGTDIVLNGVATPVSDNDAANKKYVDEHGGGGGDFVKKTGDTMTGTLNVVSTVTPIHVNNPTNSWYSNFTGYSVEMKSSNGTGTYDVNGISYGDTAGKNLLKISVQSPTDLALIGPASAKVKLSGLADPVNANDAANKTYVDTAISGVGSGYVKKTGDIVTGDITMRDCQTVYTNAAGTRTNKANSSGLNMLDGQNNLSLNAGETFLKAGLGSNGVTLGNVLGSDALTVSNKNYTLNSGVITGLKAPTNANDAANKKYVDDAVGSITGGVNGVGSVKDYGAKGDGTTDDTNAVVQCINANSYIIFPSGNYVIHGVQIPAGKYLKFIDAKVVASSETIFTANGDYITIDGLKANYNSSNAIFTATAFNYITIKNCWIDCGTILNPISFTNCNNCLIKNNKFSNQLSFDITDTTNVNGNTIVGNSFTDTSSSPIYGISLSGGGGGTNILIEGNYFRFMNGIQVNGQQQITIQNNAFYLCSTGISMNGETQNIHTINNYFVAGSQSSIAISYLTSKSNSYYNSIKNNELVGYGSTYGAITVGQKVNVNIDNNLITGDIKLTGAIGSVTITHNSLSERIWSNDVTTGILKMSHNVCSYIYFPLFTGENGLCAFTTMNSAPSYGTIKHPLNVINGSPEV